MSEATLYERLGGAFAIAAVIDHFSDAVVRNPIAGQGSEDLELDEWSTNDLGRLPGLKFRRTLWVCDIAGGPQVYAGTKPGSTPLGLEDAHRAPRSPRHFRRSRAELARSLDHFNVPEQEKGRFWPHSPRTRRGGRGLRGPVLSRVIRGFRLKNWVAHRRAIRRPRQGGRALPRRGAVAARCRSRPTR
jgi:hemoglobin